MMSCSPSSRTATIACRGLRTSSDSSRLSRSLGERSADELPSGRHDFKRCRPFLLDGGVVLAVLYRCERPEPLAVEPAQRPDCSAAHERRTIADESLSFAGDRSI